MDNFARQLEAFIGSARPVIIAVVAFALLVEGVMFIWPSERAKEAAKNWAPWIVIGAAVSLGAVAIAGSLTSGF